MRDKNEMSKAGFPLCRGIMIVAGLLLALSVAGGAVAADQAGESESPSANATSPMAGEWERWAAAVFALTSFVFAGAAVYYRRQAAFLGNGDDQSAMRETLQAQIESVSGNVKKLSGMIDEKSDAGAGELQNLARQLHDNNGAVVADIRGIMQKMNDLFDSYMVLQKNLDDKDEEIKRLKKGYDAEIFRRFLSRFIRVDRAAAEIIGDTETSERARKDNRLIRGLFEDALDECGVEKFSPSVGEDYRKAFGVAEDPEIAAPADDADKDYAIAEVLSEGYRLGGGDVVVAAKVKIFKRQRKEN